MTIFATGGPPVHTSATGIELLKSRESCRLVAYLDNAVPPVPTIGWGTTVYPNGQNVQVGNACTQAEADEWFQLALVRLELAVTGVVRYVRPAQFDALVSFTYNVGIGGLTHSTLLRLVNANPDNPGIRSEFMKWCHSGGQVNHGLFVRRWEESDQYFGVSTPCPPFPDVPRAA